MRAALLAVCVLVACGDTGSAPNEPTASAVPALAPARPPPPNGRPPGVPAGNRRMIAVNVLEVGNNDILAVGPEGEERFHTTPGAYAGTAVNRGDSVTLDCSVGGDGAYLVESIKPHTGLPLAYGTVTERSETRLTIDSPLGAKTFAVNPWSDLPPEVTVGQFVSVKHYGLDDARTVLNAKRFPGMVEDAGLVTAWDGKQLSVATLGGVVTYDLSTAPTLAPRDLSVGKTVTVRARREGAIRTVASVALRDDDLTFIGKMSSWDEASRTFAMVDAWGGVLGIVRFHWDAGCGADCPVIPGDLAEVHYRFSPDKTPAINTLTKRELTPVFFGEITEIDATHVRMVTLQNQTKVLTVTPETRQPLPIHVGDRADVIHGPGSTDGQRTALAIVKE